MASKPKSVTVVKGPRAATMMAEMERDAKKPQPQKAKPASRK
jgi:hypothetical protein